MISKYSHPIFSSQLISLLKTKQMIQNRCLWEMIEEISPTFCKKTATVLSIELQGTAKGPDHLRKRKLLLGWQLWLYAMYLDREQS